MRPASFTFAFFVILSTVHISGCGVEKPASSDHSVTANWSRFIADAKARKYDARTVCFRRLSNANHFEVQWGAISVSKPDSANTVAVGNVELTIAVITTTGKERQKYSLQFVPNGESWRYRGGRRQQLEPQLSASESANYPTLVHEVRMLFEGR